MRNKAIAVYVSFAITILTLVVISILYFTKDFISNDLLLNIFYSLFGGAFLSFILSIFEYENAKRETVNDFYDEYMFYVNEIHKIEFTEITETDMLVAEYITYKKLMKDDAERREEFLERASKLLKVRPEGVFSYLNSGVDDFKRMITKIIVSYVNTSGCNLSKLWKITHSMRFINPLFKNVIKEAQQMCCDMQALFKEIADRAVQFRMYMKGEMTNVLVIAQYADELNKRIYSVEHNDSGAKAYETIVNDYSERASAFARRIFKIKDKKVADDPSYGSATETIDCDQSSSGNN